MSPVFIATPMYGGMCYGTYMVSMLDTLDKLRSANRLMYFGDLFNESLITRARNQLVRRFLETDAEYLFFIDSDIMFNGGEVLKLLSHEKDIVCGLYPKKSINWDLVKTAALAGEENLSEFAASYVVNMVDNESMRIDENNLVEIKHGGTGFMCIHRRVFEKLADKVLTYRENTLKINGEFAKNPDGSEQAPLTKNFFALSIADDGLYLSEDYYFCELWRANGGKIYADFSVRLRHTGSHIFSGDIQHHMVRK